MLRHEDSRIDGVTHPMLYIGMRNNTFGWHTEDHHLGSINFNHQGAAKTWYGVGSHQAAEFEKVVREKVFSSSGQTLITVEQNFKLLIGKVAMISPSLLMEEGVEVLRAVQQAGDFVITFPRAYHTGFSHGFNIGEAVNFAHPDWIKKGVSALDRYSLIPQPSLIAHDSILCKGMREVMVG